jgi:two-component system, OmpR family, alkaline phosphatase synthesis response regulator PhoP
MHGGIRLNNKVLVIEDDQNILELIEFNLSSNGFEVITATDGKVGLDLAKSKAPDIVVLDLMLPTMDGIDITRSLRTSNETVGIPILMLTAKNSEIDRVIGLEIGADDYMTKPFSVRELVARIRSILRRCAMTSAAAPAYQDEKPKIIRISSLVIDDNRHEVTRNGKVYHLTLKEYELLKILAENAGNVLTRDRLLDEVWGYDYYGETRTVDVHIRHLRMKIEDEENDRIIETVRGVGYRIVESKS